MEENNDSRNEEPNEPQADVYKLFKEKSIMYSAYKGALEPSLDMRDGGLLRQLAVKIAPDKPEKSALANSDNLEILSKFVTAGCNKYGREFEKLGDDNLKTILKKVPKVNLEVMLNSAELRDSAGNKQYNDAISIHKEYKSMYKNLADYQREDTSEEQKKKALDNMKKKVVEFYGFKYGDDAKLLDALKSLAEVDDNLKFVRYAGFMKEKRSEFDNKTGDNLDSYLKSALANKVDCYSILASDIKTK